MSGKIIRELNICKKAVLTVVKSTTPESEAATRTNIH